MPVGPQLSDKDFQELEARRKLWALLDLLRARQGYLLDFILKYFGTVATSFFFRYFIESLCSAVGKNEVVAQLYGIASPPLSAEEAYNTVAHHLIASSPYAQACRAVKSVAPLTTAPAENINSMLHTVCPADWALTSPLTFINSLNTCKSSIIHAYGPAGSKVFNDLTELAETIILQNRPTMTSREVALMHLKNVATPEDIAARFTNNETFRLEMGNLRIRMKQANLPQSIETVCSAILGITLKYLNTNKVSFLAKNARISEVLISIVQMTKLSTFPKIIGKKSLPLSRTDLHTIEVMRKGEQNVSGKALIDLIKAVEEKVNSSVDWERRINLFSILLTILSIIAFFAALVSDQEDKLNSKPLYVQSLGPLFMGPFVSRAGEALFNGIIQKFTNSDVECSIQKAQQLLSQVLLLEPGELLAQDFYLARFKSTHAQVSNLADCRLIFEPAEGLPPDQTVTPYAKTLRVSQILDAYKIEHTGVISSSRRYVLIIDVASALKTLSSWYKSGKAEKLKTELKLVLTRDKLINQWQKHILIPLRNKNIFRYWRDDEEKTSICYDIEIDAGTNFEERYPGINKYRQASRLVIPIDESAFTETLKGMQPPAQPQQAGGSQLPHEPTAPAPRKRGAAARALAPEAARVEQGAAAQPVVRHTWRINGRVVTDLDDKVYMIQQTRGHQQPVFVRNGLDPNNFRDAPEIYQQISDRITNARYCRLRGDQGLIQVNPNVIAVKILGPHGDIRYRNGENPVRSNNGSLIFNINAEGDHDAIAPLYRN